MKCTRNSRARKHFEIVREFKTHAELGRLAAAVANIHDWWLDDAVDPANIPHSDRLITVAERLRLDVATSLDLKPTQLEAVTDEKIQEESTQRREERDL